MGMYTNSKLGAAMLVKFLISIRGAFPRPPRQRRGRLQGIASCASRWARSGPCTKSPLRRSSRTSCGRACCWSSVLHGLIMYCNFQLLMGLHHSILLSYHCLVRKLMNVEDCGNEGLIGLPINSMDSGDYDWRSTIGVSTNQFLVITWINSRNTSKLFHGIGYVPLTMTQW